MLDDALIATLAKLRDVLAKTGHAAEATAPQALRPGNASGMVRALEKATAAKEGIMFPAAQRAARPTTPGVVSASVEQAAEGTHGRVFTRTSNLPALVPEATAPKVSVMPAFQLSTPELAPPSISELLATANKAGTFSNVRAQIRQASTYEEAKATALNLAGRAMYLANVTDFGEGSLKHPMQTLEALDNAADSALVYAELATRAGNEANWTDAIAFKRKAQDMVLQASAGRRRILSRAPIPQARERALVLIDDLRKATQSVHAWSLTEDAGTRNRLMQTARASLDRAALTATAEESAEVAGVIEVLRDAGAYKPRATDPAWQWYTHRSFVHGILALPAKGSSTYRESIRQLAEKTARPMEAASLRSSYVDLEMLDEITDDVLRSYSDLYDFRATDEQVEAAAKLAYLSDESTRTTLPHDIAARTKEVEIRGETFKNTGLTDEQASKLSSAFVEAEAGALPREIRRFPKQVAGFDEKGRPVIRKARASDASGSGALAKQESPVGYVKSSAYGIDRSSAGQHLSAALASSPAPNRVIKPDALNAAYTQYVFKGADGVERVASVSLHDTLLSAAKRYNWHVEVTKIPARNEGAWEVFEKALGGATVEKSKLLDTMGSVIVLRRPNNTKLFFDYRHAINFMNRNQTKQAAGEVNTVMTQAAKEVDAMLGVIQQAGREGAPAILQNLTPQEMEGAAAAVQIMRTHGVSSLSDFFQEDRADTIAMMTARLREMGGVDPELATIMASTGVDALDPNAAVAAQQYQIVSRLVRAVADRAAGERRSLTDALADSLRASAAGIPAQQEYVSAFGARATDAILPDELTSVSDVTRTLGDALESARVAIERTGKCRS